MDYKKTLSWVNVGYVWLDFDTAFCNRIVNWEIAYHLKETLGEGHQILMEKNEWPEVNNDFILLPNTSLIENINQKVIETPEIKEVHEYFYHHINFLKQSAGFNHLKYTFDFNKLDEKNELFTSSFLHTLQTNYRYKIRPLSYIKIKNYLVEDYLKLLCEDAVGIHIRRGSGVMFKEDKLGIKSKNIEESFLDFRNKVTFYDNHEGYPYIEDGFYFNIIDNILKINPSQKFYISTDLPYHLISYYIERYGSNVIFKENIIDEVNKILSLSGDIINTDIKKITTHDMVDLFALSFCKFLIKSQNSTWSLFAEAYRKQPSVSSEDKLDHIIKNYNSINRSKKNIVHNINIKKLI
jgi:hypothetical protein